VTLRDARSHARLARRWGYFRNGTEVSLSCPLCRATVKSYCPLRGGVVRVLDAMMLDHLRDGDCPAASPGPAPAREAL